MALDSEKEHADNAIAVLRRVYEIERDAKDQGARLLGST